MNVTIQTLEAYLQDHYGLGTKDHGLFMKLVEEIGEVAEVMNKRSGAKASTETDLMEQLGNELADVIHYAVAIAAVNGIDIADTILHKDKKAAIKYHHMTDLEAFIRSRENS